MRYAAEASARLLLVAAALLGCHQKMEKQAHYKPLAASDLFENGASARMPIPGTVAQGHLPEPFEPPAQITAADLDRGRRDYAIHCTPCHGRLGEGDGMAVRRGFPRPAPFAAPDLRAAPLPQLLEVTAHGKGTMPGYGEILDPLACWRVVQWVRVLQLSAHAPLALLEPEDRRALAQLDDHGGRR
jgi:mono/diheme cytochrome c family protein